MAEPSRPKIVILGAGFIGLSFAAAFRDAGFGVALVEPDAARRDAALSGVQAQADAMALAGLAQGKSGTLTLDEAATPQLPGAAMVLECGPEDLAIKQGIFADLLAAADPTTLLVTASSAITMSRILPQPGAQARCLVAHPVNPPAVLRLIELVPGDGTAPESLAQAAEIFAAAAFAPVVLGAEIEGFVLNRLQGAVLREAYRLVEDGITDVAGIDTVMRLGLGPRWALSGPFETAELNTPGGIRAHAARMGPAYKRMGEARGETVDWSGPLVARVDTERRAICPVDALPAQAAWRATAVARLIALRDRLLRDRG